MTSGAECRGGADKAVVDAALLVLVNEWQWISPPKLSEIQVKAKLVSLTTWGSAISGNTPLEGILCTTLEDLIVCLDAVSKRKVNEDEPGGEKKLRTGASGTRALEQHCLRVGEGNDHQLLDHVAEYLRNGRATWEVKDKMI